MGVREKYDFSSLNDQLDDECEVYAFDSESEETIEFCFSTYEEYLSGIEEFERRTFEADIFRYTVYKRKEAKYVINRDGDDTETVRLYVFDLIKELAEGLN